MPLPLEISTANRNTCQTNRCRKRKIIGNVMTCGVTEKPCEDMAQAECPEGYFTANGPTHKARIIVRSSAVPASPAKPIEPLPRAEWPWQIKALSLAANDADTGIGDVVQRLTAALGGEQFKAAYKAVVGMPCGCNSRRDYLNSRFPLP